MKLNAISGRGSKKDFIDLYFLLKEFPLLELIGLYKKKYGDGSEFLVLKSLSYFDDADAEPMPKMLKQYEWENIKSHLNKELRNHMSGYL